MRRALLSIASVVAMFVNAIPCAAADDTILRRVSGNVGYTVAFSSPYIGITGQQALDDGSYAVVAARSQGVIVLPDSSQIGVGSDSRVQVSAFKRAAAGGGSTITIPSTGGTLRFDIKHPAGGQANYTFVTPTSSVSARGTIGLLTSGANGDVIACLECAAGDVAVTVGARVFPLLTGQTLVVSLAGVVTAGAISAAILQSFSGAGLSTTAAATSPVAGASGAAAAAGGSAAGAAAAAAAVGVGAAAAAASTSKTTNSATPTPQPTSTGVLNTQSRPRK